MAGALMQLVAYGAQDVYLTGNPQITFWKVVYRRHTNFSMETIEHTLTGTPDFGRRATATIIRNGDLAFRVYLYVTLEAIRLNNYNRTNIGRDRCVNLSDYTPPRIAWVRRLGHAIIRHVEVQIGGSQIDKQYSTWLDIWYELTHTNDQSRGYRHMIGDVDELTRLDAPDKDGNVKNEYELYVPLQFWFNRNSGLALPLIALQYHEVRLEFEFEELNKLIVWKSDSFGFVPDLRNIHMKDASILVDYIYLDSAERRRFAQVGHEYLIEQVQYTGEESLSGGNSKDLNYKARLNFNHPVKEIIWVVKNTTFTGDDRAVGGYGAGHRFLSYVNCNERWHTVGTQDAANNLAINMVRLTMRAVTPGIAPLNDLCIQNAVVAIPATVQVFDLRTNPDGHFIRLNVFVANNAAVGAKNLEINRFPLFAGTLTNVGPTGFNYSDYLDVININVDQCDCGSITATVIAHRLNVTDISIPLDTNVPPNNLVDTRYLNFDNANGNPYDIYVIQPFNYGLRLDGRGNPVRSALIQLNGHDRFDRRYGSYFNYVQPWEHHTHTPSDGINVYSFALHPEEHQPSGTANLSRIDNTTLWLHLHDPYRNTGIYHSKLVVDLNNSRLLVFAFNYNVLRIMSGMGGLAYSN